MQDLEMEAQTAYPSAVTPPAAKELIRIHDLPDECLIEILHRIGDQDVPLPIPAQDPVTHPLQCALVCRHWRALAAASVHSLSLRFDRMVSARQLSVASLGPRFSNLTSLVLTIFYGSSFNNLTFFSSLAPTLQTLELSGDLEPTALQPVTHLLQAATNLRSLRASLSTDIAQPNLVAWLDALRAHPTLSKLDLGYRGPWHSALHTGLAAMPGLRELSLASLWIPPHSPFAPQLLKALCSFRWQGGASNPPEALEHLTALTSLKSLALTDFESVRVLPECLGRLSHLTRLELSHMKNLSCIPDFTLGQLRGLQALSLTASLAFTELPETVGSLCLLCTLVVGRCSALPASLAHLSSLQALHVRGEMRALPDGIGQLTSLRSLRLISSVLEQLPERLGDLGSLEELEIGCGLLTALPEGLARLTRLRACKFALPDVEELPEGIFDRWRALEELEIRCPGISLLPDGLCRLGALLKLTLECCYELSALPEGFGGMTGLRSLVFAHCWSLRAWPEGFGGLSDLEELELFDCGLREMPAGVGELCSLKYLWVGRCRGLRKLPEGVARLPRLARLECPLSLRPAEVNLRVWEDTSTCDLLFSSDSDENPEPAFEEWEEWKPSYLCG